MHNRLLRLTIFLVLSTVVVTGCGKKSSHHAKSHKKSHATTTQTSGSSTSTAASPTDEQNANKILLTQSDLPTGWTGSPAKPKDAATQQFDKALNSCLHLPDPTTIQTASVNGSTFTNNGNTISSSVDFLKTSQLVTQDYTAQTDSKNASCITGAFNSAAKQLIAQQGLTNVAVTSALSGVPGFDPGTGAFVERITSKVSTPLGGLSLYIDLIGLAKDRAACSITLTYLNAAPPLALEQSLLTKMRAKADAAITD